MVGARRAVPDNPAAARGVYRPLVTEGERNAGTERGTAPRARLAGSERLAQLHRTWETLTLNALDGPAPTGGVAR